MHRALETYGVPKNLIGKETAAGPIPRRLSPIFRDKEDLPAAGNLNATIIDALKNSQFLIVLASPNAVKSRWVKEEIKQFKAFHGPDRVLAIIIDGEPFATDNPNVDDALECFPEPLRFNQEDGGAKIPAEPLAADARPSNGGHTKTFGKDGKKAAITKLAAGIIGVPLDDLVQREAQRRAQHLQGLAAFFGGLTVLFGGLAWFAFDQRGEAEARQERAEGLLDFMITDVREEVEQEVGRLDALEKLSDQALAYYEDQNERRLDADALGRRSRALHFAGVNAQRRNDLDGALSAYEEAAATTKELLRRDPDNEQRVFEHAQSVFYVGNVLRLQGNLDSAEQYFNQYLQLAEQLVSSDPNKSDWRLEVAYATSNLGALKIEESNYAPALEFFNKSAAARKQLYEADSTSKRMAFPYAYALSWKALAELELGDFKAAIETIDNQLSVYDSFPAERTENFRILDAVVTALRRKAEAHLSLGEVDDAETALNESDVTAQKLLTRDPDNAMWKLNASHIDRQKSLLAKLANRGEEQQRNCESAVQYAQDVLAVDATNNRATDALALGLSCLVSAENKSEDTETLLRAALDELVTRDSAGALEAVAAATIALAKLEDANGESQKAKALRERTVKMLEAKRETLTTPAKLHLLELYIGLNDRDRANQLASDFEEMEMKHPTYTSLRRQM